MDSSSPTPDPDAPADSPVPLNHRILSILWIAVSIPAVFLMVWNRSWLKAPAGMDRLRALTLEQWVAVAILVIQMYLLIRAHMERVVAKIEEQDAPDAEKNDLERRKAGRGQ